MKVLVTAGLSDYKLRTKLAGLAASDEVSEIIVLRRRPLPELPKVRNLVPQGLWARSRWTYEAWRFWTLRRLLKTETIGTLIAFQLVLHGVQAALAGRLCRVPSVLAVVGSDIHIQFHRWWLRPVLSWALRQASGVCYLGPRSREKILSGGVVESRLFELQNHQYDSRYFPKDEPLNWDLLFVGSLVPVKRVEDLLAALAKASARLPELRVAIVGDGPERQKLERQAADLDLTKQVEFLGERGDVENYLRGSRALILVSRSEAMPACAVEAMYCGRPTILTDVGDVRQVFIDGENSLLVPPGDVDAIAAAIVKLLSEDETYAKLRRGALEAREKHRQQWNLDAQRLTWERILDHVSQERSSTSS